MAGVQEKSQTKFSSFKYHIKWEKFFLTIFSELAPQPLISQYIHRPYPIFPLYILGFVVCSY